MTAINRIVSAEGAPWADAQALRNDTPPSSVAAARDFWLCASAGGTHTLEYSLRTPQGAACLATNLAIEAIVAKFATNVYYAAYGQTNGEHSQFVTHCKASIGAAQASCASSFQRWAL